MKNSIEYKKPFKYKGKTYRLVEGLLVDSLQVKQGARYTHISNVVGKFDAMCVIKNQPRKALEG